MSICSQGIGNVAFTFDSLSRVLEISFARYRNLSELNEAIVLLQSALELRPPGNPNRSATLNNLGIALMTRFKQVGDRADLAQAIVLFQSALELRPPGHPNRYRTLNNLASALIIRFERLGDRTDLDEAIVLVQSALEFTPWGHPDRSETLNNLASALKNRFEEVGDRIDSDQAIVHYRSVLELRPQGHPKRSGILNNLASTLLTRFEQIGNRTDLDEAIVLVQSALELAPPGHPDRERALHNVANALMVRFRQLGDRADLNEAIITHRSALELRPPGHPNRFKTLNNLANALKTRFEQVGDRTDLDEAIVLVRSALELTPPGHPDHYRTLNNLAISLLARFEQVGDHADLDEAIFNHQSALELTPSTHSDRSKTLRNLASVLLTRFEQIGDRADLDQAIVSHRTVLELRPPGHPDRSGTLIDLATALWTRFELIGDLIDLHEAISNYQSALELIPPAHPDRSATLFNLALCRSKHLESMKSGIFEDPSKSSFDVIDYQLQIINLLKEGASPAAGGPLSMRLQSALLWACLGIEWSDPSALDAYQTSIGLLEMLIASGRTLESRHLRLTSVQAQHTRTLAVDGAACAISAGQITTALEMLEQGRGVLLAQAGRYRTQSDDLEGVHPALAADLLRISAKMETSVMALRPSAFEDISGPKTNDVVADYQRLSQEWDDILRQIRTLDGFSTFLQPTPFLRLQAAAAGGSVIVINFSQSRTDAIVVLSNDDPHLVPLPHATAELIAQLSEQAHHNTKDPGFKGLLLNIWRVIVQPIVKVLRDDLQLPVGSRIWWCPTGAIAHLPLHAAGDYTRRRQNLPDLFISSYTPTLSALIRAQEREPSHWSITPNILVVGQPDTPGEELPYVNDEIGNILSLIEDVTILNGSDGTRDSVISALTHHPCIHLACHGHVNEDQPFRSSFSLYDGPLDLLDITRQNLPRADLAFLSACHSAAGNRDRPDEVLHLAAGMQFAGFRSVVGTMWALCDLDGPVVAEAFYSSLVGTGDRPKAKSSAHALHRAVAKLRGAGVSLSRWACFVHFGC